MTTEISTENLRALAEVAGYQHYSRDKGKPEIVQHLESKRQVYIPEPQMRGYEWTNAWRPHGDIAQAKEVMIGMQGHGYWFNLCNETETWVAHVNWMAPQMKGVSAEANTIERAICKAALSALGEEILEASK